MLLRDVKWKYQFVISGNVTYTVQTVETTFQGAKHACTLAQPPFNAERDILTVTPTQLLSEIKPGQEYWVGYYNAKAEFFYHGEYKKMLIQIWRFYLNKIL